MLVIPIAAVFDIVDYDDVVEKLKCFRILKVKTGN